jgi:beta-phosphoglucomutase-like phosphatase (HAD superfamily)
MFISINTNDHSREASQFAADTLRELGLVAEPTQAQKFRAAQSAVRIARHMAANPPVPGTPEFMDLVRMKNAQSWSGSYMDTMEQKMSMAQRGLIQFF